MKFLDYKNMFTELVKQITVNTSLPIISMIVTYDSTRVIAVSSNCSHESFITMYDLESYKQTFIEKVGTGY